MHSYKCLVRTRVGTTSWVRIEARSMWEAEQLAEAFGDVLQVVPDMGFDD